MPMNKNKKVSLKTVAGNVGFAAKYIFSINKKLYILRFILIPVNILSTLMTAFFMSYILNQITSVDTNLYVVFVTILTFALVTLSLALLRRFLNNQNTKQTETALCDIKLFLGQIVSRMQYSDIEDPQVKDFISLASSTNSFFEIIDNFTDLISAIISAITYASLVLYVQPLILILIVIVVVIRTVVCRVRIENQIKWRTIQAPIFRKLNYLFNVLSRPQYGKEMRINMLQGYFLSKIHDYFENECIPPMKKSVFDKNKANFITDISQVIQSFVIYTLLAIKVVYDNMRIGDFTLYLAGANNLTTSLTNIVDCFSNVFSSGMFASEFRYCVLLSEERQKTFGHKELQKNQMPCIEFRDVSFKYPESDMYVLKHVSFKIEPMESLSLVGINGSGKSTIVKLLCRFYMPTEGDIFINGLNIKDISPEDYEALISVVFQDYKLFSFTIRENIVMGDKCDEKKVLHSVEKSGLGYKVSELVKGLDTFVYKDFDESGIELSGGEGQKLAIARAIFKNAPIMILDEPTAALDPMAEYDICKRFFDMTKGKCSIFISHRLSSTKFTKKIAVLDDGELREFGTHGELMNIKNGIYKKMFEIQAHYYKD